APATNPTGSTSNPTSDALSLSDPYANPLFLHAADNSGVYLLTSIKECEQGTRETEEEVKKVSREEVRKVAETTEQIETPKVVAPTHEQILAIKAAIINSQTIEEIARLEQALKFGQVHACLIILDTEK
ncbi:hypothetical protein AALP_AAs59154U000100, partial [Arabis alpina]